MVNYDDILTKEEINIMARYIQRTPDVPPEFSLKDMEASWKLLVPVEQRPKKQMNKVNLKNVFAITLRDTGKLALIDGDTKNIWQILDTGYAVHISRLSASGRYVYTVGRDGLVTLIDLWFETPTTVATVKLGADARSVDTSKFKGFEDKYLIGGTYWPPQYSIMDGETLKPMKIVSTRGNTVDGEYHPEPRVASIVSSMIKPEWVVNVKETGQIMLVDYSDIKNLKTTTIESAKFLHDGGWDEQALLPGGGQRQRTRSPRSTPRPASSRHWSTPRRSRTRAAAPTSCTRVRSGVGHRTPGRRGDHADLHAFGQLEVRQVQAAQLEGGAGAQDRRRGQPVRQDAPEVGQPVGRHADEPRARERRGGLRLRPEGPVQAPVKIDVAKDSGLPQTKALRRATHPEYNQAGDEVWISLWGGKTDQSAIVVYDDKTLKLKKVITDPRSSRRRASSTSGTRSTTSTDAIPGSDPAAPHRANPGGYAVRGRRPTPGDRHRLRVPWPMTTHKGPARCVACGARCRAEPGRAAHLMIVGVVAGIVSGAASTPCRGHQQGGLLHQLPRDARQRVQGILREHDPLHQPHRRARHLPRLPRAQGVGAEDAAQDPGLARTVGQDDRQHRHAREVRGQAPASGRARVGAHEGQRLARVPQLPQLRAMAKEKQKPRAKKSHELAVKNKETCIDCHKGIAHHKPKGMKEDDE
jgi:nitrite reductase (NO-forming)/hydroxylamine reductase